MKHVTDNAWPYRSRDYGEPVYSKPDELHWSPSYGPHICRCWGAGWLRGPEGELLRCDQCKSVEQQQVNRMIGRCWEVSKLQPDDQQAPTLQGFRPHDERSVAMMNAARSFALKPIGWLTIYGTRGAGKSHLAEAITRYLLGHRIAALYMRAPDLLEFFGAVERPKHDDSDYAGRREWAASLPVLVIDEFNEESNSDAAHKYRRMVLDTRYQAATRGDGGATVLISNATPESWHDAAITSRARDTRFVCLEATPVDFRRLAR